MLIRVRFSGVVASICWKWHVNSRTYGIDLLCAFMAIAVSFCRPMVVGAHAICTCKRTHNRNADYSAHIQPMSDNNSTLLWTITHLWSASICHLLHHMLLYVIMNCHYHILCVECCIMVEPMLVFKIGRTFEHFCSPFATKWMLISKNSIQRQGQPFLPSKWTIFIRFTSSN